MYVFGCKSSLFRLCDSDFGITPIDDITIGITWTAFCFHIAHIIIIIIIIIISSSSSSSSSSILLVITFMQGIYNYKTEKNHVSVVQSVAAVL